MPLQHRRVPGRGAGSREGRATRWLGATGLALVLAVVGCASYRPANQPLEHWDPDYGYRPEQMRERRGTGEIVLLLAFSGGGTRAAALSYGVLEELRETEIVVGGERKRLLDEVDVITSVSGGSFTSAYYGLFGERIFQDYEERFLRRNVQGRLLLELLRPVNWFRLAGSFTRTELAIQYYDQEIFEGATFTDLLDAGGPLLQINAADLAAGNRFTFFQPQFDLICSDLSALRVARAVAASSGVPVLFPAVTLRNYAGTCGYEASAELREALADRRSHRRHWNARIATSYLDAKRRPYIHLVDGGISDNVGLRGPLDEVLAAGGIWARFREIGVERPAHVVVVVVDAEVHREPTFSRSPSPPSMSAVMGAVTGVQLNRYTFETIELFRTSLEKWAQELPRGPEGEPVRTYMIEVAFDMLDDPEERAYFHELPTSFKLDDEAVDRLIAAGRTLLRESPEMGALLDRLRQRAPLASPSD
jgi:NTE family protein